MQRGESFGQLMIHWLPQKSIIHRVWYLIYQCAPSWLQMQPLNTTQIRWRWGRNSYPRRSIYYASGQSKFWSLGVGVKADMTWSWSFSVVFAGGDVSQLKGIDGLDMWSAISHDLPSPRTRMLVNIDDRNGYSALRFGRYKYVNGECWKTR
jgi:hypothetical protein